MIIIAFAPKTSKILPNLICKNFKHCAVIVRNNNEFIMYQFISWHRVERIQLKPRDIRILGVYGWRFVYVPCELPGNFPPRTLTCVALAKRAIGMKAPMVQTPDALYRRVRD